MAISVEHRYENGEDGIRWVLEMSDPALDAVWKEDWLRDGIGSRLTDTLKDLEMAAGAMRYKCSRIVMVAEGMAADLLQVMLPLAPESEKVRLVRPSLSGTAISQVIEDLEQESAGLIGIALEPETAAFCATYATLRKVVADRYSQEKKERLKVVLGPRSTYLKEELERGDLEGFEVPAGYDPGREIEGRFRSEAVAGFGTACMGASVAMLFPMMVAGVDAAAYVRGFREMLSSTWWDQDADRYGLRLGSKCIVTMEAADILTEDILYWQPELAGICRWMAAAGRTFGADARALCMPGEEALRRRNALTTTVLSREEAADIMLPMFPGVSPEGSLNEMLKEHAEALFARTGGTKLCVERMDAEDLGRLMAYLQLTYGIAGWVVANA